MARDPAFLFYPDDWAGGTRTFTKAQRCDYLDLLCVQHAHDFITREDIIDICGSYDEKIARKFSFECEPGHYQNERLRDEKIKRAKYSESRRHNRFGSKEESKENQHMSDTCQSYDVHMGNGNGNTNENVIKEEKKTREKKIADEITLPFATEQFKNAWQLWKQHRTEIKKPYRPTSEIAALKQLFRDVDGNESTAISWIENAIARTWQGIYEPKNYNNGKINQSTIFRKPKVEPSPGVPNTNW